MTVFKNKRSARWVCQIYDAATKRAKHVGTFATRREARDAEQDALRHNAPANKGRQTVAEYAERWLHSMHALGRKQSTIRTHTERLKPFLADHGHQRLDAVTRQQARAWAAGHRHQAPAVRAMFNAAIDDEAVRVNPFANLRLEQSRGRRDLPGDWLTLADIDHLCETALRAHPGPFGQTMAALIRFAAFTGIRPGELFALEHSDLNARDGTVTVRRAADSHARVVTTPKNGRPRVIVYPEEAQRAVDRAARLVGQELVFTGPRGQQLWANSFSWLWQPVRVLAGRPSMGLHELRHFCATYLLQLGLAPWEVAVQLGHTDNGALVMSTYGHPSEDVARAKVKAALDGHQSGDLALLRGRKGA